MQRSRMNLASRKRRVLAPLGAAMLALGAMNACETTGGAASAPAYNSISGTLKAVDRRPLDTVYAATQKSLEALEFRAITKVKDGLKATLTARTAKNEKVSITLARVTDTITDVEIQVGPFGDERESRVIFAEMRKH